MYPWQPIPPTALRSMLPVDASGQVLDVEALAARAGAEVKVTVATAVFPAPSEMVAV